MPEFPSTVLDTWHVFAHYKLIRADFDAHMMFVALVRSLNRFDYAQGIKMPDNAFSFEHNLLMLNQETLAGLKEDSVIQNRHHLQFYYTRRLGPRLYHPKFDLQTTTFKLNTDADVPGEMPNYAEWYVEIIKRTPQYGNQAVFKNQDKCVSSAGRTKVLDENAVFQGLGKLV